MMDYHVLIVGQQFTYQFFKPIDITSKIHKFIFNGGGIVSSYNYNCYGCFLNPTNCTDITEQCLHNALFAPMGLQFLDSGYVDVNQITFSTNDTMPLQPEQIKQYVKMNQTFNSSNYGFMKYGSDWSKIL